MSSKSSREEEEDVLWDRLEEDNESLDSDSERLIQKRMKKNGTGSS